ncbi:MAG: hypothetical protein JW797_20030 [Bradymonadales bacterium]|nr:hypothetical protein [Bradymonadales bacterium]
MKEMHYFSRFWLFASLVALLAAVADCSDDDPSSGGPTDDLSSDLGEDLAPDQGGDLEDDLADAVEETDAADDLPADEESDLQGVACGQQPTLPECETTTSAPTANEEIEQFAADNAIPLTCVEEGHQRWEFDIFFDELASNKLYLMGEVHGSNEIGPASADLFEALVREEMVDLLVLEIGMDVTDALNEYVETGEGPFLTVYGYSYYGPNMYRRTLPDRARALHLAGTTIPIVGVDPPQRLAWVNEQIHDLADGLTDETIQGLILDDLPRPREMDDYGLVGLETDYVTDCQEYHQHIVDNLQTICTVFDEAACERMEYMAFALYMGAAFNSQELALAAMDPGGTMPPRIVEWLTEREELIFWNFRQAMPTGEERIYGHMGAAHAAKTSDQLLLAGMMNTDFEPTAGQVYTITPAYGPGSAIFYGLFTQDVPPEPELVSNALSELEGDRYFLSTHKPGIECLANPFLDISAITMVSGANYGTGWDAFFWFSRLTPDIPRFGSAKVTRNSPEAWTMDNLRRTQWADRQLSRLPHR